MRKYVDYICMAVKQEPVNIKLQIIFVFIPFLNLYACYKIQKLRLFLIIFIPLGILSSFLEVAAIQVNAASGMGAILYIFSTFLLIAANVWLVYKWSKQWNEKFS